MDEQKKPQVNTNAPTPAPAGAGPASPTRSQPVSPGASQGGGGPVRPDSRPGFRRRPGFGGGPGGRDRKPFLRKKEEFQEQVVDLRRVARVMAGGKRFKFRATIILGDLKGRVGIGMGKGIDVAQAVGKAKNDAQKNIITIRLEKGTIPHQVDAKFSAARVMLKPAKEGNGLVAGGAVRTVLALAGIREITAKCLGRTPNKVTNAMATIEALKKLKPARRASPKPESIEKKIEAPAQ